MTRSGFLKCCAAGACACVPTTAAEPAEDQIHALQWKVDFAQRRFAKLVEIIDASVDEPVRRKIWESLGRDHAREYRSLTDKYKGDLKGFLAEIQRQWVKAVEYDEAAGTIRVIDKSPVCTCPLVRTNLTPKSFCDCSVGWQKEAYSAVTGRPVEVEVEESILRGGQKCVFRIRLA